MKPLQWWQWQAMRDRRGFNKSFSEKQRKTTTAMERVNGDWQCDVRPWKLEEDYEMRDREC